jgi:hypothetical protein
MDSTRHTLTVRTAWGRQAAAVPGVVRVNADGLLQEVSRGLRLAPGPYRPHLSARARSEHETTRRPRRAARGAARRGTAGAGPARGAAQRRRRGAHLQAGRLAEEGALREGLPRAKQAAAGAGAMDAPDQGHVQGQVAGCGVGRGREGGTAIPRGGRCLVRWE